MNQRYHDHEQWRKLLQDSDGNVCLLEARIPYWTYTVQFGHHWPDSASPFKALTKAESGTNNDAWTVTTLTASLEDAVSALDQEINIACLPEPLFQVRG